MEKRCSSCTVEPQGRQVYLSSGDSQDCIQGVTPQYRMIKEPGSMELAGKSTITAEYPIIDNMIEENSLNVLGIHNGCGIVATVHEPPMKKLNRKKMRLMNAVVARGECNDAEKDGAETHTSTDILTRKERRKQKAYKDAFEAVKKVQMLREAECSAHVSTKIDVVMAIENIPDPLVDVGNIDCRRSSTECLDHEDSECLKKAESSIENVSLKTSCSETSNINKNNKKRIRKNRRRRSKVKRRATKKVVVNRVAVKLNSKTKLYRCSLHGVGSYHCAKGTVYPQRLLLDELLDLSANGLYSDHTREELSTVRVGLSKYTSNRCLLDAINNALRGKSTLWGKIFC